MGALATVPLAVRAQAPAATGSIIVPFSAGSVADVLARRFAALLAESTQTPYVTENAPGAQGVIAARAFLKRPPDGRTLLWGNSGLVCSTPLLAKPPLEFDPARDFVPVAIFINTPFVLFAGKDFPASNLAELQRVGREQKEPLTYVGGDTGGGNHVAAEVLWQRMGLRGTHIPYRNNQQAYIDVSEGRVQLGVFAWSNIAPLAASGKVKVLALMSDRPLAADPLLPTVRAQGFGSFDVQGWFGVFVPRGTPAPVVAELERQVRMTLRNRGYADFLAESGQEVVFRGHAEARAFIEAEVERYRTTLQQLKLI